MSRPPVSHPVHVDLATLDEPPPGPSLKSASQAGPLLLALHAHEDHRGFFMETFREDLFADSGVRYRFVQDNISRSHRNTLRGLHYQLHRPQGKLIAVIRGEIFDVAVDLRRRSPTFGHCFSATLGESNPQQLFVPPGFAHGFFVTSEEADVIYKCTDFYFPEHSRTLAWDDPELAIPWPLSGPPVLSEKDARGVSLQEVEVFESMG